MRLIDGDDLFTKIRRLPNTGAPWLVSAEAVFDAILKAPTIEPQPEQRWIPCGERLPDGYATVLITHRGGVSFGWYNGRYWERGANAKHRPLQTVIAWMPLPEPYKEGQG